MGRTLVFLAAAMYFGGDKPPAAQPSDTGNRPRLTGIRVDPMDQLSVEDARRKGSHRAETDYENGTPEIETFGLVLFPAYVDAETGLRINSRGCVFTHNQQAESRAYNDRVRELVKEKGLPARCVQLKERFERAKELSESPPKLKWITVPLLPRDCNGKPIKIGNLTVTRKTYADTFPHSKTFNGKKGSFTDCSSIAVNRESDKLVAISVSFRDPMSIALLEKEGFLIVRGSDWTQRTVVFDTKHDRILVDAMPGLMAALKNLEDPSTQDKPEPHF